MHTAHGHLQVLTQRLLLLLTSNLHLNAAAPLRARGLLQLLLLLLQLQLEGIAVGLIIGPELAQLRALCLECLLVNALELLLLFLLGTLDGNDLTDRARGEGAREGGGLKGML